MSIQTEPASKGRTIYFSRETQQLVYRLLAVVILCIALSLATEAFLTVGNILNVLRQASLLFFLASGLTLVILTGGIDLSIGATISLCACLAGTVIQAAGSPVLGTATGLGVGMLIGLCNGLIVARLRIPPFIATYGMMWVVYGITYTYMAGETIYGFPPGFRLIGSGYFLGIPIPIYVMLFVLAFGTFVIQRTVWGQQIYAIGANPEAARLSGIPVDRRVLAAYVLSGSMAGLASIIFLARLNSAQGDIGEPMTLSAVAAVLVGGASLFGGVGSMFGTFVGALMLTFVLNGMNLLSINANWQPLVTGLIVMAAVWLDIYGRRRSSLHL